MFFNNQDNEKKIKALLQEHEALNQAIDALFKESNLSEETLARFQQLKTKLSPDDLKAIDRETEKLKSQTQIGIDQVRNPKEMEKRYRERNVPQNWLFVR